MAFWQKLCHRFIIFSYCCLQSEFLILLAALFMTGTIEAPKTGHYFFMNFFQKILSETVETLPCTASTLINIFKLKIKLKRAQKLDTWDYMELELSHALPRFYFVSSFMSMRNVHCRCQTKDYAIDFISIRTNSMERLNYVYVLLTHTMLFTVYVECFWHCVLSVFVLLNLV